jgi:hypothetical protein
VGYTLVDNWEDPGQDPNHESDVSEAFLELTGNFMDSSKTTPDVCMASFNNELNCEHVRNRILAQTVSGYGTSFDYSTMTGYLDINYQSGDKESLMLSLYEDHDDDNTAYLRAMIDNIQYTPGSGTLITDLIALENHMSTFALMLTDDTVTDQELCDMFFGGILLYPECMEGRQDLLDSNIVVNAVQDSIVITPGEAYEITLHIYSPETDEEFTDTHTFKLYTLGTNQYFMETFPY